MLTIAGTVTITQAGPAGYPATQTAPPSTVTVVQTSTTTLTQTTCASDNSPPGYGVTTTSANTPPTYPSNCATPPGNFHIQVQGTNEYLAASQGGANPSTNNNEDLVTANGSMNGVLFTAGGSPGQITISAGGVALYSDQDQFNGGSQPIYFDNINNYDNNGFVPVEFCLNSDNTFTVQNPAGANGMANVVQICSDGVVYLFDAATAASFGCNTVTLVYAP